MEKIQKISGVSADEFKKWAQNQNVSFYTNLNDAQNGVNSVNVNLDYFGDNGNVYIQDGRVYEKQADGTTKILAFVNENQAFGDKNVNPKNNNETSGVEDAAYGSKVEAAATSVSNSHNGMPSRLEVELNKHWDSTGKNGMPPSIERANFDKRDVIMDFNDYEAFKPLPDKQATISNIGDLKQDDYAQLKEMQNQQNIQQQKDMAHIENDIRNAGNNTFISRGM